MKEKQNEKENEGKKQDERKRKKKNQNLNNHRQKMGRDCQWERESGERNRSMREKKCREENT